MKTSNCTDCYHFGNNFKSNFNVTEELCIIGAAIFPFMLQEETFAMCETVGCDVFINCNVQTNEVFCNVLTDNEEVVSAPVLKH